MAILGRLRRRVCAVIAAAGLAMGPWAGAASAAPSVEYVVKANYLYKFTPFVEWPASAFVGPTSPFVICVVSQDPFGDMLDQVVRGHAVGDHPITIARMAMLDPASTCHLTFVAQTARQSLPEIARVVAHRPNLVVGERGGGDIQFMLQDGRVRFDIDQAEAQASGIVISSKLLDLSVSRRRGPR
jgi:hypothetical protein